jgi:uncharacterized membrane protein
MRARGFWTGFAWGAATVAGTGLAVATLGSNRASRILRLEKSIQIAKPLHDVFDVWSNPEDLSQLSGMIASVRSYGNRSRWTVTVNGMPVEWEAEITQFVPYQAIGWKSLSGPKHSGRISFSQIGEDTLVHVHMNYAPPMRIFRPLLSPFSGDLEGYIEQALREIKSALENRSGTQRDRRDEARGTGTYGPGPELLTEKQNLKYGAPSTPVEYTAPPEAKR